MHGVCLCQSLVQAPDKDNVVESLEGRSVKLTLAYDGTDYVGWQRQANGVSIQAVLEDALARIEDRRVTLAGSGRTDAGVHALGQVASVRLCCPLNEQELIRALNSMLPRDIRVLCAERADSDFHARYAALSKTYRYRVVTSKVLSPFEQRYSWHVTRALDSVQMRDASTLLCGRHDFSAFQVGEPVSSPTIRTIFKFEMQSSSVKPGDEVNGGFVITFEITGDGFLRHMVRSIVGTLVQVGSGKRDLSTIERALRLGDRTEVGPTAPARGLFLVRVNY